MKKKKLKMSDGFSISVSIFEVENPKAILQMIHGAKEHKKRYYEFIEFLNQHGIMVAISDNRGHGKSVDSKYPLGFMNSYERIIEDQHELTLYLKEQYPGLPFYLFGHSLGSMFARVYLEKYDCDVDKLVLSGTANYIPLGIVGIGVGNFFNCVRGPHGYSKLLERFANFLDDTWVVGNPDALEKYRNDPLCTYPYPIASMVEIFKINRELHAYKHFLCQNPQLPILSVSGVHDPVTGGEKGLEDTMQTLKKIGYHHLENIVYPDMYHEVLNEVDHQKVYDDIFVFLES